MPRPPSGPKLYIIDHPRTPYQVRYRHNGKAVRQHFAEKTEAEQRLAQLQRQFAAEGTTGLVMDAQARSDYFAARKLLGHVPLLDAVRYYVHHHPHVETKLTVSEAQAEWLLELEVGNLSARTRKNLRNRTTAWILDEGLVHLDQLTRTTVLARLARHTGAPPRPVSARTRVNDLTALRVFCQWLKAKAYVADDPTAEVPFPKTDTVSPRTLTPAQAQALMRAAEEWHAGAFAPYFALALFAGLRPTEIAQLRPDQVRLDGREPTIRIVGGKKRRSQRIVPVLPNLRRWLGRFQAMPYRPAKWLFGWNRVRELAGLREAWDEDICRHSFVSYRLADVRDEAQVGREAGHRPDTAYAHYFSLHTRVEARQFFGIAPKGKP